MPVITSYRVNPTTHQIEQRVSLLVSFIYLVMILPIFKNLRDFPCFVAFRLFLAGVF